MIPRIALGFMGAVAVGWGAWKLFTTENLTQITSSALWLGGGVIAHDAVLAPVTIAGAWLLSRIAPGWLRGPATAGAIVLGVLTMVAVPVLGGWGRRADNPTLLPRDYWAGWCVLAGLILVGVVLTALVRRMVSAR